MELQQESCIRQASSVLKDGHVMEAAEAWGGHKVGNVGPKYESAAK